jgi:predicted TIM-barrel fold metal-dependent hydrolase
MRPIMGMSFPQAEIAATADQTEALRAFRPIDCDLHPDEPSIEQLLPYLDAHWREAMVTRGIDGVGLAAYPPRTPLAARPEWRDEKGRAAADVETVCRQALDGWNTSIGILNCLHGAMAMFGDDMGAALARAVNDWLAREWLDREPRLRASITLCLRDPAQAVAEIERRAVDPRFVQILVLASGDMPLGRRLLWPVYETAQRHGLPIGIHAGSANHHPTTSAGWPSYYVEDYVAQAPALQNQLLSLIAEGVFTRFPDLRVVLLESGVTWLPAFLWRATKIWRALRAEVPWVDRSPAEIVRQHVRLTLQPFDAPADPVVLPRILAQIGSERILLFSTDYPHWQFDTTPLPAGVPASLLPALARENALETYPRLKEAVR